MVAGDPGGGKGGGVGDGEKVEAVGEGDDEDVSCDGGVEWFCA